MVGMLLLLLLLLKKAMAMMSGKQRKLLLYSKVVQMWLKSSSSRGTSRHLMTDVALTVIDSCRLLSSVVPNVKGPDSTFFRLSFTSTSRSSTSTLRCSASRHSSSFCFERASSEACCWGSGDNGKSSVTQINEGSTCTE